MTPDLSRKLQQLSDYLDETRGWLAPPTPLPPHGAERILERMTQLIVECAADAGDIWLQENGRPLGQSAAGVFRNLHQAGKLDAVTAERFRAYVRTRNRIIHDYDLVDPRDVRQDAEGLVADLSDLLRALQSS